MQIRSRVAIAALLSGSFQLTMLSSLLSVSTLLLSALPAFAGDPVVCLNTTKGPIYIRVFINMVPNTAGSFLDLVQRGFYSGSCFHRVENWCIQGGGPNGNPNGIFVNPDTGQPRHLRLEINRSLSHGGPGVVAMARTSDPNSASCQFYITKSQTRFLDGKYAIFGGVVQGMNTVYSISPGDQIMSAEIVNSAASQTAPPPAPAQEAGSAPPARAGKTGAGVPRWQDVKPTDSGF